MINEQDAIKAAETLKEWCKGRVCRDCKFRIRNFNDCTFRQNRTPEDWHIPKPRHWTDDDIQLAKVLSKVGVISYDTATGAWWFTKNTGGNLPKGLFSSLKNGEIVSITEIIGDSE